MEINQLINNFFSPTVLAAVISVFLGYILYEKKLEKQQKNKVIESFSDERTNALLEAQELSRLFKYTEDITITHKEFLKAGYKGFLNGANEYHEIMENRTNLQNGFAKLVSVRRKDEWLSNETAAILYYGEQYFKRLFLFVNDQNMGEELYPLGLIIGPDLICFAEELNKSIINELNNPPIKNEIHSGVVWERTLEYVKNKMTNMRLNQLINSENLLDVFFAMFMEFYSNINL